MLNYQLKKICNTVYDKSPVLRRKTNVYLGRSEEEIYEEVTNVFQSDNPRLRF